MMLEVIAKNGASTDLDCEQAPQATVSVCPILHHAASGKAYIVMGSCYDARAMIVCIWTYTAALSNYAEHTV